MGWVINSINRQPENDFYVIEMVDRSTGGTRQFSFFGIYVAANQRVGEGHIEALKRLALERLAEAGSMQLTVFPIQEPQGYVDTPRTPGTYCFYDNNCLKATVWGYQHQGLDMRRLIPFRPGVNGEEIVRMYSPRHWRLWAPEARAHIGDLICPITLTPGVVVEYGTTIARVNGVLPSGKIAITSFCNGRGHDSEVSPEALSVKVQQFPVITPPLVTKPELGTIKVLPQICESCGGVTLEATGREVYDGEVWECNKCGAGEVRPRNNNEGEGDGA